MKLNNPLLTSKLFDERTFYQTFLEDLKHCQSEIIIESPFITTARFETFDRFFQNLIDKGVKIYLFTRDPTEHEGKMKKESEKVVCWCEAVGIQVFICSGNHHRKLAIVDRQILWEGSLNILSQSNSKEFMRRIDSKKISIELMSFLRLDKII